MPEAAEAAEGVPAQPPAAGASPPASPVTSPAAPSAVAPSPPCEDPGPAEVDLASLPRLEDLTAGSDLSLFLRKGVPEALRNAALRRVWSLDPTIRDFIGPADYAWDWNVPGGVPDYVATIAHGPDVEALADRILGIVRDAPREPAAGTTLATDPVPEAAPAPSPTAVRQSPPNAQHTETAALPETGAEPGPPNGRARARTPGSPEPEPHPAALQDAPEPRPRHGGAVPT